LAGAVMLSNHYDKDTTAQQQQHSALGNEFPYQAVNDNTAASNKSSNNKNDCELNLTSITIDEAIGECIGLFERWIDGLLVS
jgi:hypothetical protein